MQSIQYLFSKYATNTKIPRNLRAGCEIVRPGTRAVWCSKKPEMLPHDIAQNV